MEYGFLRELLLAKNGSLLFFFVKHTDFLMLDLGMTPVSLQWANKMSGLMESNGSTLFLQPKSVNS